MPDEYNEWVEKRNYHLHQYREFAEKIKEHKNYFNDLFKAQNERIRKLSSAKNILEKDGNRSSWNFSDVKPIPKKEKIHIGAATKQATIQGEGYGLWWSANFLRKEQDVVCIIGSINFNYKFNHKRWFFIKKKGEWKRA